MSCPVYSSSLPLTISLFSHQIIFNCSSLMYYLHLTCAKLLPLPLWETSREMQKINPSFACRCIAWFSFITETALWMSDRFKLSNSTAITYLMFLSPNTTGGCSSLLYSAIAKLLPLFFYETSREMSNWPVMNSYTLLHSAEEATCLFYSGQRTKCTKEVRKPGWVKR